MVNFKTILFNTLIFCTISLVLIFLNVLIFFLVFGSGAGASKVAEKSYVNFLLDYLPLFLPILYLVYLIFKFNRNKHIIKRNSFFTVLILLIFFFFIKEHFLSLIIT